MSVTMNPENTDNPHNPDTAAGADSPPKPDISKPDISKPDISKPDISKTDIPKTDTSAKAETTSHAPRTENAPTKPARRNPIEFFASINQKLDALTPFADLIARLWVAWAFYSAGLTKVTASSINLLGFHFPYPTSLIPTESTLLLFKHEYSVPLVSPTIAAYMGSPQEVLLPIFIAFGLAGRYAAIVLFLFNIVAVISYPAAQTGAGFIQHQAWGILLLLIICRGPGKISIDYLIKRILRR
jgi:putative oxidoreductase